MPFQNYVPWNNAQGQLIAGISAGSSTFILQSGQGDRFPSTFPFLVELKNVDIVAPYAVLKREIGKVTGKTWDTFTVVRSSGTCLPSDASNTPGTTAFSFSTGDTVTLTVTAETIKDIQDELVTKLPISAWLRTWFWTDKHVRVNRSTGAEENKNVTTSAGILSSDKIRIEKLSGDYEDATVSQFATATTGLTSEYTMAGSASVNESVYLSVLDKFKDGTTPYADIGKTVATTSFRMYASGATEQRYTFSFTKTGTPQDLTFRIETDSAGAPSGTLVNANAVLVTSIASITSGSSYEIVLPASFVNASAGTPIWFVFWQGSQYVNASNHLSVAINKEVSVVFDRMTSPGSNITATRPASLYTGTLTNPVWSQIIDVLADVQLVSVAMPNNCSIMEIYNVTDGNIIVYRDTITRSGYTFNEPVYLRSGKRYEIRYTISGTVNNVTAYGTVTNSAHVNWISWWLWPEITNIVTRTITVTPNAGVLLSYISKALATTAIKAAVYGLLPSSASAGGLPAIKKDGYLWWFSGLVKGNTYYLSNTGVISSTAGTVSKVLGVAINTTTIRIDSAINAS